MIYDPHEGPIDFDFSQIGSLERKGIVATRFDGCSPPFDWLSLLVIGRNSELRVVECSPDSIRELLGGDRTKPHYGESLAQERAMALDGLSPLTRIAERSLRDRGAQELRENVIAVLPLGSRAIDLEAREVEPPEVPHRCHPRVDHGEAECHPVSSPVWLTHYG